MPNGPPSLLRCDRLTVKGAVVMMPGVSRGLQLHPLWIIPTAAVS